MIRPDRHTSDDLLFSPVSLRRALGAAAGAPWRNLLGFWVAGILASVALGLGSIKFDWSGIPVGVGDFQFFITIYPPLIICTLFSIWLGFWWGVIPAFISSYLVALYSGMPQLWALLFGFVDVPALGLLVLAYRALPVSTLPSSLSSWLFYLFLLLVGSISTSFGALIWTHTNNLGIRDTFAIWEGWWIGGFVVRVLGTVPILLSGSARVARWKVRWQIARQWQIPERRNLAYVLLFYLLAIGIYSIVNFELGRLSIEEVLAGELDAAAVASVLKVIEPGRMLDWIDLVMLAFTGLFGYLVATNWSSTLQKTIGEQTRELESRKRHFENIVNKLPDGLSIFDPDGQIMQVNATLCELTGYSQSELIEEKNPLHFLQTAGGMLRDIQERTPGATDIEWMLQHRDGSTIPTLVSRSKLFLEKEHIGFLCTIKDISTRKAAEETLLQSREELRKLATHLQDIRELERSAISREIHDEMGQLLSVMKMDLSRMEKKLVASLPRENLPHIQDEVEALNALIDQTAGRLTALIGRLRPEVLDHLGLTEALEWQCEEFGRRSNIKCWFATEGEEQRLDESQMVAVFRIVQEALTNVARHSKADSVEVQLKNSDDSLRVRIADNGVGINEGALRKQDSFGILGMRERALVFDGTLKFSPNPVGGTTIELILPLKNAPVEK